VAVDDRSSDATGQILDDFAALHPRLRVVHVVALPPGGSASACTPKAYEAATGEWLVFTDADVRIQTRRAAARRYSCESGRTWTIYRSCATWRWWDSGESADHLLSSQSSISPPPRMVGSHRSPFYVGIGAFNHERSAYEASGTHRRLAMEVIDDMKLGKIDQASGTSFRGRHFAG